MIPIWEIQEEEKEKVPVYLISYDLKKPGQNYNKLHDALKSTGTYAHVLDSSWLVNSPASSADILRALCGVIDVNDSVFITEVAGAAWRLPIQFNDWVEKQLDAGPLRPPDKP